MSSYKEIVTKAVIGKGKKTFTTTNTKGVENKPSTILGCWVINHKFNGEKQGDSIVINGSYDVNVWYSYDNDTKTAVLKDTDSYTEVVNIKRKDSSSKNEEIIVRSLNQPNCIKVDIDGNNIIYTIEKELGIELVGDTKVRILTDEEDDDWDEILDDPKKIDKDIDEVVDEEFIKTEIIEEKK